MRRSFNFLAGAVRFEFNLFISTNNLNDSEKKYKTIASKFNYTFDGTVAHVKSASDGERTARDTEHAIHRD